ncbi:MAG: VanZ family protein, partial [Candidatus Rokuibacteriota bacterium]
MRSRDSVTGKKQASLWRGATVTALAMAVILIGTLWPMTPRGEPVPFFCLLCGEHGLADWILNVALFVPLGVGLVIAGLRPATAVGIGLATTIGVEALQVNVVAGRDTSLSDILSNTLGTLVGALGAR